jgi:hypothetical protein
MLEVSGLSKPTLLKGIRELHSRRALGGDGSRIRRPKVAAGIFHQPTKLN